MIEKSNLKNDSIKNAFGFQIYSAGLGFLQKSGLINHRVTVDNFLESVTDEGTKLQDSLPRFLVEGLESLCNSLTKEAQLNPIGLQFAHRLITRGLNNSLRRISKGQLDAPSQYPGRSLFILSLPRVGSTLVHNILAQCDGFYAPVLWQLLTTEPRDISENLRRKRLKDTRRIVRELGMVSPAALDLHPIEPEKPDECHFLYENSFASPSFLVYFNIPGYLEWLENLSRHHREAVIDAYVNDVKAVLGDLSFTWLSKTPTHLFFIDELRQAFPNASYIRLHRHPAEAILSFCQFLVSHREVHSDDVSMEAVGKTALRLFRGGIERLIASDSLLASSTVVDISYKNLVSTPEQVLTEALNKLGYVSPGIDMEKMRDLPTPPRRNGIPKQTLEHFCLDKGVVDKAGYEYMMWADRKGIRL